MKTVPDTRIPILADWLEKQITDPLLIDKIIMEKIGVVNGTYYRLKPEAKLVVSQRLKDRQKQIEVIKTKGIKQELKTGLKTKAERVLIYQEQVDACLREIDSPGGGEPLRPIEKAALWRTLKELMSEISKIEGDYAPTKVAPTDVDGNDLIDYSKLNTEILEAILRINDGGDS